MRDARKYGAGSKSSYTVMSVLNVNSSTDVAPADCSVSQRLTQERGDVSRPGRQRHRRIARGRHRRAGRDVFALDGELIGQARRHVVGVGQAGGLVEVVEDQRVLLLGGQGSSGRRDDGYFVCHAS
jgi:hypothetical protein